MAIQTRAISDGEIADSNALGKILRQIFSDLEDQLNNRAQIYATNGTIPAGVEQGSIVVDTDKNGTISIKTATSRGFVTLTVGMLHGLLDRDTNFRGILRSLTTPLTDLTFAHSPGDWGFYHVTSGTRIWLWINSAGTFKSIELT